jgi:hypothetical protein
MDQDDIIGDDFDSPAAIRAMRKRQVYFGRLAQEIALAALVELKAKLTAGEPLNLTYAEAETLRGAGVEIELAALRRRQRDDGDAPIPPRKPN